MSRGASHGRSQMKRAVITRPGRVSAEATPDHNRSRCVAASREDATALTRAQAATKLEERGKAIANDRRRVWAGREPELADVNTGLGTRRA